MSKERQVQEERESYRGVGGGGGEARRVTVRKEILKRPESQSKSHCGQ